MMMRTAQWGVIIGLLALTAGMGVRMYTQWQLEKQPQMLSEFSFLDGASTLHSSNEWKSKIVVINFWATWCPSCLKEIPSFMVLQSKYGNEKVQFIGIALDDVAAVKVFQEKRA